MKLKVVCHCARKCLALDSFITIRMNPLGRGYTVGQRQSWYTQGHFIYYVTEAARGPHDIRGTYHVSISAVLIHGYHQLIFAQAISNILREYVCGLDSLFCSTLPIIMLDVTRMEMAKCIACVHGWSRRALFKLQSTTLELCSTVQRNQFKFLALILTENYILG
jgi:hypothetical protein